MHAIGNVVGRTMKKVLVILGGILLLTGAGGYLFKEPLWEFAKAAITADMFVAADTDSFDPGIAVGQPFPPIKAIYNGQEIADVGDFVHDKGMVFIANRSADW
jgi:hypothetical protein